VSIITLVSDFGTRDAYVGVLHGVILGIHPGATVVDICHDIPAQDVRSAAFVLSTAYPYFPRGTVHVVIVDPGVGTQRRAIAMRTAEAIFVAPDNGVLSYVLARQSVLETVHLTQAHYWLAPLSETFHGRDLFAPVAAHLALGTPLHEMGPAIEDAVQFPIPTPLVHGDGSIEGEVLHVDHFGNLITNVPHSLLPAGQTVRVRVAGHAVAGPYGTYALAVEGECLALVGSHGYLEIAARNGSAAAVLNLTRGAKVWVAAEPQHR